MSVAGETEVIKAESRLRQAMLSSDIASMDQLISGELLSTNHLGRLLSKQADLCAPSSDYCQSCTPLGLSQTSWSAALPWID